MPTRATVSFLAAMVVSAMACESREEPRREGPDPELMELRRLQSEVARAPSVKQVMAAETPVDLEALPDKPRLPPGVLVEERVREPEPPPMVPTEPLAALVIDDQVDLGAVARGVPEPAVAEPPALALPPSPVQRCLTLYGKCRGKGWDTDVCVRDIMRCELTSPTVTGPPPCCPAACMEGYAARRRGGQTFAVAGAAVFTAEPGGCLAEMAAWAAKGDQGVAPAPELLAPPTAPQGAPATAPEGVAPAPTVTRVIVPAPAPAAPAPAPPARPQPAPGGAAVESEPRSIQSQPIP